MIAINLIRGVAESKWFARTLYVGIVVVLILGILEMLHAEKAKPATRTTQLIPFEVKIIKVSRAGLTTNRVTIFGVVITSKHDQPLTMFGTLAAKKDGEILYSLPLVRGKVQNAKAYGQRARALLWRVRPAARRIVTVKFPLLVPANSEFCLRTVVASLGTRTDQRCYPVSR